MCEVHHHLGQSLHDLFADEIFWLNSFIWKKIISHHADIWDAIVLKQGQIKIYIYVGIVVLHMYPKSRESCRLKNTLRRI